MKNDISDINDIRKLVDTFYSNAVKDPKIGHIFEQHLKNSWDEHMAKLYRFWQTVILKEMAYYGRPAETHFNLGLSQADFQQWLNIWTNTVDSLFAGPKAENAKLRGRTMAEAFWNKIEKNS